MQTQLKSIKIKSIILDDDHLSVEHATCGQRRVQWLQELRKVTIKRFSVAALDENLISIAKHQGAKTVPLRLENPIALCGQFIHPFREHRQDRRIYRKVHTPWYNVACSEGCVWHKEHYRAKLAATMKANMVGSNS